MLLNWLWILLAWLAVGLCPTWPVVAIAFLVVGNRYYSLFIIGHDGLHRRLFSNGQLNERFNDLFILGPIGAVTRINKKNHLTHHRLLATDQDPDRHRHGCFNKSDHKELTLFLTGFSALWTSVRRVYFSKPTDEPQASDERLGAVDFAIVIGWQLLLWVGLGSLLGWWAPAVLFFAPVYALTFLTDNFRSFAEHSHPEPDAEADLHRLLTYHAPRWELELFAPMNMNYHATHHLWPSIPYYNLPFADRLVQQRNTSPDLEWRDSYLAYLYRYWMSLPIFGCKGSG